MAEDDSRKRQPQRLTRWVHVMHPGDASSLSHINPKTAISFCTRQLHLPRYYVSHELAFSIA